MSTKLKSFRVILCPLLRPRFLPIPFPTQHVIKAKIMNRGVQNGCLRSRGFEYYIALAVISCGVEE